MDGQQSPPSFIATYGLEKSVYCVTLDSSTNTLFIYSHSICPRTLAIRREEMASVSARV